MLATIVIGLLVGAFARWIKPGDQALGWIMTAFIGVGGAVVATYIGQQLGWYARGAHAGFLASIGGAVILLTVWEVLRRPLLRRQKERPADPHA